MLIFTCWQHWQKARFDISAEIAPSSRTHPKVMGPFQKTWSAPGSAATDARSIGLISRGMKPHVSFWRQLFIYMVMEYTMTINSIGTSGGSGRQLQREGHERSLPDKKPHEAPDICRLVCQNSRQIERCEVECRIECQNISQIKRHKHGDENSDTMSEKMLNGMSDYLPGRMSDYVSNRVPGSARHAAGRKFPK